MRQMIAPDLERRCFQGEIFLEKVGVPCTQQRVDDIILDFFSGKPDHLEELLVSGNFHLVPVPSMSGCNMKLAGICKQ
ncbi:MAG: hypothetical protein H6767_04645 [Candidatus Peribacteria bacterium]|nr:MAG: hypothetical protein H6767_04645 [Candidatus Peribacteria bacterium]